MHSQSVNARMKKLVMGLLTIAGQAIAVSNSGVGHSNHQHRYVKKPDRNKQTRECGPRVVSQQEKESEENSRHGVDSSRACV